MWLLLHEELEIYNTVFMSYLNFISVLYSFPLGTETSANTNNETTQAGMSVSSTEVVSTDTLTE